MILQYLLREIVYFITGFSLVLAPHASAHPLMSTSSSTGDRIPAIDMPLIPGFDMTKTAITLAVNVWIPYDSCTTQPTASETKPLAMDFGDGATEKLTYQGISCASATPFLVWKGANHTYQSRGIYTVKLLDASGVVLRTVKVQN